MTARPKKAAAGGNDEICTIRIELVDSDPPIWRDVEVPTSLALDDLHIVVQIAMAWENCHLWEFTIAKTRYGEPSDEDWRDEPAIDAARVRLRDVTGPRRTTIAYHYDFGDNWQHKLIVTKKRPPEPGQVYPRYVAGERNAPPEDSGGIFGYYEKLKTLDDPGDPDHADIKQWLGAYDRDTVDAQAIGDGLYRFALARRPRRKRAAKLSGG